MLLSVFTSSPTTLWPAPSCRARLLRPCARGYTDPGVPTADALLQSGLRPESLPRHVAVVMDGNTRWARARGLSPVDGHAAGGRNLELIVGLSRAWGIRALTAFVCSQENLNRPKAEVDSMMGLSEWLIGDNIDKLARQGIRLQVIGDSTKQPASLQAAAKEAAEATCNNSQLHVMLAICYSGRWDVVQACRELARAVQANELRPDDIDESLLAGKLVTGIAAGDQLSCPDLVIRTSDFGEAEYLQALRSFQSRHRLFGQQRF